MVILLLLLLAGCDGQDTVSVPANAHLFTDFLDVENFVPGIPQRRFVSQMEEYCYQGISLADLTGAMFYDGNYGGGYSADGELFGFSNDYVEAKDGKTAVATNSLYMKVSLDRMTLPYGICFGDNLTNVLQKMDIEESRYRSFISRKTEGSVLTLYSDGETSLVLTYREPFPAGGGETLYCYELKYTEPYRHPESSKATTTATRSISMCFTQEDHALDFFKMAVCTNYQLD